MSPKIPACLQSSALRGCVVLIAAALLAHGACAQNSAAVQHYPPGSIHSVEAADRALSEVNRERAEIEQRFTSEQNACYERFFASVCMDSAKERRRGALMQLRPIEIEANAFKRQARALEREQAQEEKRVQDEAKRRERAREQEEPASAPAPAENMPADNGAGATQEEPDSVRAAQEARQRRSQAEQAAEAGRRAKSTVAYQKKVQAAQARQKAVEIKKLEKERARAMKQTSTPAMR